MPTPTPQTPRSPTEMDDYLFDLNGYLVLRNALSPVEVQKVNAAIDDIPPLRPDEWRGNVHRQDHDESRGVNLQNIVEGGEPFERLIDHSAWLEYVSRYVGVKEGLFIDECFATLRGPSGFINIHSGGHYRRTRVQYDYRDGQWHCGQINILLALTDIHHGDGATVVIPGSHKSLIAHPVFRTEYGNLMQQPPEDVPGAIPVYLNAGDAILFVDAISHGGSSRLNPGLRRTIVYRYGPMWGNTRFGYRYSDELIARLTTQRARILRPTPLNQPPGGGE